MMANRKNQDIKTERTDIMPIINGEQFHCYCWGNVFKKVLGTENQYKCNSCGEIYSDQSKTSKG